MTAMLPAVPGIRREGGGTGSTPTRSRRGSSIVAAALLLVAACGDGEPSGPGTLEVRVVPPPSVEAGAVVLEVTGPGIQGFEAAGSARVFGAPYPPVEGRHRVVVLVDQGDLVLRIRVDDRGRTPEATVVEAADRQNRSVPGLSAFQVRISR